MEINKEYFDCILGSGEIVNKKGNLYFSVNLLPKSLNFCKNYSINSISLNHKRKRTIDYIGYEPVLRAVFGTGKCIWQTLRRAIKKGITPLEESALYASIGEVSI